MDSYAYYNGKFGKRSDIQIPLSDRSIFFGDAIYDAALVVNGKIVWEKEHINRFFESASALFIPIGFTKEELKQTLRDTVKKSNFENAFLYFQLSRSLEKRAHSSKRSTSSNLLVTTEEFTLHDPSKKLSLITYPDKRYKYCNIKTLNLLPSVLAATEADKSQCDEAVFIRDGFVTECSRSNIFIAKGGVLKTHPRSDLILPGIARMKVIEAAEKLGLEVIETPFTKEEILSADEVIITSTTKLCLGAKIIDGVEIGAKNSALTDALYVELHREIDEFSSI